MTNTTERKPINWFMINRVAIPFRVSEGSHVAEVFSSL